MGYKSEGYQIPERSETSVLRRFYFLPGDEVVEKKCPVARTLRPRKTSKQT